MIAFAQTCIAADAVYFAVDAEGVPHYASEARDAGYRPLPGYTGALKQRIQTTNPGSVLQHREAARVQAMLARKAAQYRVPLSLAMAVAHTESGLNMSARSARGAVGVMQLMPDTSTRYGVADPADLEQNIDGGMRVLRALLDRYQNNFVLVLAAYNAGEAAVTRHGDRIPPFPETMLYVPSVLSRMDRSTVAGDD